MLGLSNGMLVDLLGGSGAGGSIHPMCPSSWGHHLQEIFQSLPWTFLASCLGLCRNFMKSVLAAGEEDPEVQRDG